MGSLGSLGSLGNMVFTMRLAFVSSLPTRMPLVDWPSEIRMIRDHCKGVSMRTLRRRLTLSLVAALVLVGFMTAFAHPTAQAHANYIPSCINTPSEAYCDGVDPTTQFPGYTQTCASSASIMWTENFTVNYTGSTWQTQMRYSSTCKTRWTRLVLLSGSNGFYGEIDGGRTVTDTGFQTILGPTSLYSGAYTDMWYAPADTSNNYWQSQADAYNNACGAHGYVVYWPSDNSEYPCA